MRNKNIERPSAPGVAVQRIVGQRTCMVIADRELCENKAEWRVRSYKHRFDMFVCPIHGKAFLGMKGVDVEPMSNAPGERAPTPKL